MILVWALMLDEHKAQLWILVNRIHRMMVSQGQKMRNYRFVFEYLKEAYTISLSKRTGTTYTPKIRVKVGKLGLPLIIPGKLRHLMMESRLVYIAVMTILCLHRIVPYWPAISFSTITEPFNGLAESFDFNLIAKTKYMLCRFSKSKLYISLQKYPVTFLELNSSSPNSKISWHGIIEDAFAFYSNPKYYYHIMVWYFLWRGYGAMFSLSFILLFGWPIWLATGCKTYHLGRLGIVYNVSGKSRVIGITNYWLQIGLYPLHKNIFDILSKLSQDGTFDQLAPLTRLQEGNTYYSYDLTAATDRLPLKFQKDVLECWTSKFVANVWSKLASVPFWCEQQSKYLTYSVGQPMGMYSSWAMLALTHHTIVCIAMLQSKNLAEDYAILGDDVVVPESISSAYANILRTLGVSISMSKSIVSNTYVEFAKKVKTLSGVDYSVIGPGLILSVTRNRLGSAALLAEALLKQLVPWCEIPSRLSCIPNLKQVSSEIYFSFGISLISRLSLYGTRTSEATTKVEAEERSLALQTKTAQVFFNLRNLKAFLDRRYLNNQITAIKRMEQAPHDMWELALQRAGYLGPLYFLLLWFSPYIVIILNQGRVFTDINPWENAKYLNPGEQLGALYKEINEFKINSLDPLDQRSLRNTIDSWKSIYDDELKGANPLIIQSYFGW